MEDSRFIAVKRGKDCLNCDHHVFTGFIACNHPERPNRPIEIIRWGAGCPQHIPLKDSK